MLLRDMPWKIMKELLILDYDGGWEKLCSEIDYTWADRQKLIFMCNQGKSPTQEIITRWSYREATIYDLCSVLHKIDRLAELAIIEQFLKSQNMPIKEQSFNDFSNQNASCFSMRDYSTSACESLQRLNPNCLPRPSERNLLQPKDHSHLLAHPEQPLFHKPINTDSHNRHDSINVNKATNHKDAVQVPKMGFIEVSTAAKSLPQSKNLSSLNHFLELGCLFTYKEISCATNGFSEDRILGSGAFGTVYYGKLKATDYAIKKLTKDYSGVNNAMTNLKKNALDELMIQLKFRHPNVLNLYGYSLDSDETCFVYEYMANGSLEDCLACIKNTPPITWCERLRIAQGAACGLQYLHTQTVSIIHGDVKSANILIDKHKEAKIGDFGLAMFATKGTDTGILSHVSSNMTGSLFGTVAYMPPEFLRSNGKQYLAGDVYSFGVVLHEILTGQKAYDEKRVPKKFLMEYIDLMLAPADENLNNDDDVNIERLKEIIDPKAGACFENIIVDLYQLATKCIRSKKKDRPCMLSVFEALERINIQLNELMEETKCNSLPYQLQQMYDESNHRSSSGVPPEQNEETAIDDCYNKLSIVDDAETEPDSLSLDLNSSGSDSLPLSSSDMLRKKYEEKTLPDCMDTLFKNYKNLTDGSNEEE